MDNETIQEMMQNPEKLQNLLAFMQATHEQFRFPVTYPNLALNTNLAVDKESLEAKTIEIFKGVRPDYRVQNLATNLLVERVLRELEGHIGDNEVTLTNGCCNSDSCPTTVFIGCILSAMGSKM